MASSIPKSFPNFNNVNVGYQSMQQSNFHAFSGTMPKSLPRKRDRSQLEPNSDQYDDFQTPHKKAKRFHFSVPPPNTSFDDDTKLNTEKKRSFRNEATESHNNGRKARQQNSASHRKQRRQFSLQQKYQNAVNVTNMCQPSFWNFNQSRESSMQSKEDSVPYTDSDEEMTEYPTNQTHATNNENTNQSNFPHNATHFASHFHAHHHSTIPPTTPNPRAAKYQSEPPKTRQNTPNHPSPPTMTQSTHGFMNQMPTNQNNNQYMHSSTPTYSATPQRSEPVNAYHNASPNVNHAPINVEKVRAMPTETHNDVRPNISENANETTACTEERERKEQNAKMAEIERQKRRKEKEIERDEMIRKRSEKRIQDLRNDKINEIEIERQKTELRDRIHPQIIRQAHNFKHNPIGLIRVFFPKTRVKDNADKKEILRAFKRCLANFHPDRTVNKPLPEQIKAEEIFKLLSKEKEEYEKGYPQPNDSHNYNSYHKYRGAPNHNHHYTRQGRHGWF